MVKLWYFSCRKEAAITMENEKTDAYDNEHIDDGRFLSADDKKNIVPYLPSGRKSFADTLCRMYMLAHGSSLNDTFVNNREALEKQKEAGNSILSIISENGSAEKNAGILGELYGIAGEKFLNEKFPSMDDDKNALSRLGAIKEFAIDYSQSLTELGQYKKFKESFMKSAGVSDIEKIGTAISKAGYLSEILYNGINPKENPVNRSTAKKASEDYAVKMSGQPVREAQSVDLMKMYDRINAINSITSMMPQLNDENSREYRQCQAYVMGKDKFIIPDSDILMNDKELENTAIGVDAQTAAETKENSINLAVPKLKPEMVTRMMSLSDSMRKEWNRDITDKKELEISSRIFDKTFTQNLRAFKAENCYIDGMCAVNVAASRVENFVSLPDSDKQMRIKTEIVAAMLSGRKHIEMPYIDSNHLGQQGTESVITEIKADLGQFGNNSKLAERLYGEDEPEDKSERIGAIRDDYTAKIYKQRISSLKAEKDFTMEESFVSNRQKTNIDSLYGPDGLKEGRKSTRNDISAAVAIEHSSKKTQGKKL